jgi:hypothetical protein
MDGAARQPLEVAGMQRIKMTGLTLIAVLAMTAVAASSAAAAPKYLELYNNGVAMANHSFFALISTSDDITFSGENGTFSCKGGFAGVYGGNENNGEKKDYVELTTAWEDLDGGEGQEDCLENVTAGGFPWIVTLGTNGKASVAGKMTLAFAVGCEYSAKKLSATQTFGKLTVDMSGTFKVVKADKKFCEPTIALNTGTLEGTGDYYEIEKLEDYVL